MRASGSNDELSHVNEEGYEREVDEGVNDVPPGVCS